MRAMRARTRTLDGGNDDEDRDDAPTTFIRLPHRQSYPCSIAARMPSAIDSTSIWASLNKGLLRFWHVH